RSVQRPAVPAYPAGRHTGLTASRLPPQALGLRAAGLPDVTLRLRGLPQSTVDVERALQYLVPWRIHSCSVGRVIWTITQDTPPQPSSTTFDHNSAYHGFNQI